ncbi:hypothetical protein NYQ10_16390 [Flavobacterium johnsoniae]|uniref:hypothetical protein n=1 Tax=Flavobacterium johnsoniae TaxID=986 RepID=UPI0025B22AC8|nr:hypothetical protein [Flavobacterium johnsoniae]WJS93671.1 hypothetical protein NYQ10_16390 [Flavobacterium johnsoniae]
MKKLLIILLFSIPNCYSQKKLDEQIAKVIDEGKKLYRSEMASWYGTDLFLEKYQNRENIGGYFSYSENDISKCIFFSKDEKTFVIGTISFDKSYNIKSAQLDLTERSFSKDENDLYIIRQKALNLLRTDTIFKQYENTNPNLIPIISNGEKKVYVLTGPSKTGVVIYGNDYLITFDKNNNLINRKVLHANIIPVNYGDQKEAILTAIHSHLPSTGELITPTDICTTMLYEKYTGWESVMVISNEYVSIWNCKNDELAVMTKKAFEKMSKK